MKEKLKTNNSIRDCLAFVDIKYSSVLKIFVQIYNEATDGYEECLDLVIKAEYLNELYIL